jgi:hypothetical protein
MDNERAPASRSTGRLLVLFMAILVIVFLLITFWGSRTGNSASPAPVRNSQQRK